MILHRPLYRPAVIVVVLAPLWVSAVEHYRLRGAIDLHCHSGPDVVPRSVNDIELAQSALSAGLRAVVIKSHHTATADRAQIAHTVVPGVEVFGGIALNHAFDGLNPEAVRRMTEMDGHRGKFVWLPTFDAENAITPP